MPLHSKRIFIVSVLTAIIAAGTGCSITRSYEPRFEVVSLTIEPVPLRREQVEDPVTETAIVVSPDSTFTFKNLRAIPCQLREYSIEYTFVSFEKPLPEEWPDMPEDWEGKTPSDINKDLAGYNRSGDLSLYLEGEEEKSLIMRIAWGGTSAETPGELYSYMESPNWDADIDEDVDDPPDPGDDPDIQVQAKITVTGVDEYSKLIEAQAVVTINTDILIAVEE